MSLLSAGPGRLGGRYDVLSLLGTGGMADVYLAQDTELGRRVAVKVLRDASGTGRFRAEARTLARLRHPSLVQVLDLGETDGRPYLVLELVEGPTLADRLRGGPLPPTQVAAIGAQVAGALAHVHEQGVLHRDVSPGNVLLDEQGRAHLSDFGIARLLEDQPPMTAVGETLGTVPYLAPEQVRGEELTEAVDIYSLGLVLLEALTGERAYPGTATEAALARLHRSPDVPVALEPEWRDLLTSMTASRPQDRPTAAVVQERLARLADDVPRTRALTIPARTASAPPPVVSPMLLSRVREVPRWAWVGLALLALVLLLAVWPSGGSARKPAPTPSGVPSGVAHDLQQLHDAVAGR